VIHRKRIEHGMLGIDNYRSLALCHRQGSVFQLSLEKDAISLCIIERIERCIGMLTIWNLYDELFLSIIEESVQCSAWHCNITRIVHGSQHCSKVCHRNEGVLLLFYSIPLRSKIRIFLAYGTLDALICPLKQRFCIETIVICSKSEKRRRVLQ